MKKHQILLLLVSVMCICLFGLAACQPGKDPTNQPTHAHDLEKVLAKPSTCAEQGNIEYWYCTDCDKFFSDAEAKTEITKAETLLEVDSSAHTYGEWETVTEPTCEAEGLKSRTCSVCSDKESEVLAKVAHTYGEWKTVTEATCAVEGKKEKVCSVCGDKQTQTLPKLAHTYGEWTTVTEATCALEGKQERVCSTCNVAKETKTLPKVEHTYGEWVTITAATCEADGKQEKVCSVCNDKQTQTLAKLGHKYGEWVTITAATCEADGKQEKVCSVCNDKQTQTLAKLGHKYGEWTVITQPTCTAEGKQERECSVCGGKETQTLPMVEHTYGDWITVTQPTCKEEGVQEKLCSVCSDRLMQTLPKLDHTYGEWITTIAPTCQKQGEQEKTCSVCGDKQTQTMPTVGHSYGEWLPSEEPTCQKEGIEKRYCEFCKDMQTRPLPKVDHKYGEWTTTMPSSCFEQGIMESVCEYCGDTKTQYLPLTDHTYGEWTTKTEPTCQKEGVQEKVCSACGNTLTQALPKLDHTYGEWTTVTEATCEKEGVQERVCLTCNLAKETQTMPKIEHTYGEWTTITEPTCQVEGKQERHCIYCKEAPVETQTLPKVDHKYGEWMLMAEPTCQVEGSEQSVCEYCGLSQTKTLPKVEHKYDETGHCIYCQKALQPSECTHENVNIIEVEGGHRTICITCQAFLTEVTEHTFLPEEYSYEEIDGEPAHGRKCIECGTNVIEKCTVIGPTYIVYYSGEEINHKCHAWYCSVCKRPDRDDELHSFYRSEAQSSSAICEECGYNLCVYQSHTYEGGVCRFCGHKCQHENIMSQEPSHLSYNGDTEKMVHTIECQDCGSIEEECTFNNGVCTVCQGKCGHNTDWNSRVGYTDQGSKHSCDYCGLLLDHEYSYVDRRQYCIWCGHECAHEKVVDCRCTICKSPLHVLSELLSDERGHYRTCSQCSKSFIESDHVFDETGKCTKCDYIDQSIATCEHEPSDNFVACEGGHRAICKKCKMEYGEALPHVEGEYYVSATNGEGHQKQCSACGAGFGEIFSHVYDKNGNDYDSSCTLCSSLHTHNYDSVTGVCSTCNHTCQHSGPFQPGETGHFCGYCYKEFSHNFDSNGYCGCGYSCQHQYGFNDGVCSNCGFTCPHAASFNPMNETEHACSLCHLVFPHNYDSNGTCMQCYSSCPHRYVSINDTTHRCEICNREEMHVMDMGMPCYCGYQCAHKDYMTYDDHCECNSCHIIFQHGEEPCIMCGNLFKCDHTYGFTEITEQGHTCSRCAMVIPHSFDEKGNCMVCGFSMQPTTCEHNYPFAIGDEQGHTCGNCGTILPHNYDEMGNCTDCGFSKQIACEHDFSGGIANAIDEGHAPMCTKCGATGEFVPHTQGGYRPEGEGHRVYCAACGYLYGEILPHIVESDGSGSCVHCSEYHEHSYSGGICATCGRTCTHPGGGGVSIDENYHSCWSCKEPIPHNYSDDGHCYECNFSNPQMCKHMGCYPYDDNCHTCGQCGAQVPHNYDEGGYCPECGYQKSPQA